MELNHRHVVELVEKRNLKMTLSSKREYTMMHWQEFDVLLDYFQISKFPLILLGKKLVSIYCLSEESCITINRFVCEKQILIH